MPIDASIPLQSRVAQTQDPYEVVGRMLSLRDAAQQAVVRNLQATKARRDLEEDDAVRSAIASAGGDPEKAAAAVSKIDPKRALEIWKSLDERQKAAIAREKEVAGMIASEVGGILAAPPEARQTLYSQRRAALLQEGYITPEHAPEQWTDAWGTQVRQRAMTAKEQIDAAEKAIDQEIQRERDEEARRQHEAAERDRETQREESRRHNQATEATAARNAAAAERRAAAAEVPKDPITAAQRSQAEGKKYNELKALEAEFAQSKVDGPEMPVEELNRRKLEIENLYRRSIGMAPVDRLSAAWSTGTSRRTATPPVDRSRARGSRARVTPAQTAPVPGALPSPAPPQPIRGARQAPPNATAGEPVTVMLPDGRIATFPTPEAAAAAKQALGIP